LNARLSAHLRFGPVSRPLDLIDNTAMAIAPVDKVPGLGGVLPDHRPLAAVGLITPHAGLFAMQQIGHTALSATLAGVATTAWISLLRRSTPKCLFMPGAHFCGKSKLQKSSGRVFVSLFLTRFRNESPTSECVRTSIFGNESSFETLQKVEGTDQAVTVAATVIMTPSSAHRGARGIRLLFDKNGEEAAVSSTGMSGFSDLSEPHSG
jgi:hypothetical protein